MTVFRLLGPFEVRGADGTRAAQLRRKQRELLALLLLRPGEPIGRDELVETLWDGHPPVSARANLQSYLSGLRRELAVVAAAPTAALRSVPGGYQLDLDTGACDVQVFQRLVSAGREAAEAARAIESYGRALRLWRGPALEGVTGGTWLPAVRAGLEAARIGAIEEELELRRRLGLDPGLGAELSGPPAISARRPPRTREADAAGAPPGAAVPPAPPADFTGRAEERVRLRDLLTSPESRRLATAVVGVTGLAGVGKTALVLTVGREVEPHFPDGRLSAGLRSATGAPVHPGEILGRLLLALGERPPLPPDLLDRTARYRSRLAGRKMLVVLDDAVTEEQVRPLLPGSASCSVVITSRRRLRGVEGARWLTLEELPMAEAVLMLTRADGRFALQPHAAARVAASCGRMPSALGLAARRLAAEPSWRPSRLARSLSDERGRLDALGDRDLRTALRLGGQDLGVVARRLLFGLSLAGGAGFPDSLVARMLAAVDPVPPPGPAGAPGDRAEDPMEALLDAHFVVVAGPDATGRIRYRVPDLVRLAVCERAEQDGELAGVLCHPRSRLAG